VTSNDLLQLSLAHSHLYGSIQTSRGLPTPIIGQLIGFSIPPVFTLILLFVNFLGDSTYAVDSASYWHLLTVGCVFLSHIDSYRRPILKAGPTCEVKLSNYILCDFVLLLFWSYRTHRYAYNKQEAQLLLG